MQLKINQVVSSSTKVENSLDELVFKQSQTSSIKSSNSLTNQTVLVEQTIGGILSQLNQSQAELDSKLSAKMTEKSGLFVANTKIPAHFSNFFLIIY